MSYPYGKSLFPSTVGFDRLMPVIDELLRTDKEMNIRKPNFPYYNIVKIDDHKYDIEIAVAGFSKSELSVETKLNELIVSGVKDGDVPVKNYLHHGLASRNFSLSFKLADTVVVNSADIIDGVLVVSLENMIPEEKRPRLIPIGSSEPKLLTE